MKEIQEKEMKYNKSTSNDKNRRIEEIGQNEDYYLFSSGDLNQTYIFKNHNENFFLKNHTEDSSMKQPKFRR